MSIKYQLAGVYKYVPCTPQTASESIVAQSDSASTLADRANSRPQTGIASACLRPVPVMSHTAKSRVRLSILLSNVTSSTKSRVQLLDLQLFI